MARYIDRLRQEGSDRLKAVVPLSARSKLVRLRLRTRIWTSRVRTLPDVLIVGGQRCGTSSLYKYLGRHPNVAPSLRKEIEYFSTEYERGESWYRAHFPLTIRRTVARLLRRPLVTFEATPDYLLDPRAPRRAHDLVPDAKLIVMLREPAERAVSHYHHSVRNGLEDLDLVAALAAEEDRLEGEPERTAADERTKALPLRRFSYVMRGRYAEQLERWLRLYPRERVLVIRFDDFTVRPVETFERILGFLDLPPWQPPEFRNYSYVGATDGGYKPPPAEVAEFLFERFEKPNAALVDLLGEEFRWDAPDRS